MSRWPYPVLSWIRRLLGHDKDTLRTTDDIPDDWLGWFYQYQGAAVEWFQKRHGRMPIIPSVRLQLEDEPIYGQYDGVTPRADLIRFYRGAPRWKLEHEIRHTLCMMNGQGDGEEVTR